MTPTSDFVRVSAAQRQRPLTAAGSSTPATPTQGGASFSPFCGIILPSLGKGSGLDLFLRTLFCPSVLILIDVSLNHSSAIFGLSLVDINRLVLFFDRFGLQQYFWY